VLFDVIQVKSEMFSYCLVLYCCMYLHLNCFFFFAVCKLVPLSHGYLFIYLHTYLLWEEVDDVAVD